MKESRKQELLEQMDACVLEMEDEAVAEVAKAYVREGFNAYDGIMDGLSRGMEKAGKRFEEEEYFVPELLICSDAMYRGMEILQPHLQSDKAKSRGTIILGVVEGDTHDIGKSLVKAMLEAAGFEVCDLGCDVPARTFVDKAKESGARLICLSTLMATTMAHMKEVIDLLSAEGLRPGVKVMIGGGPVSQKFADEIGADYYTDNAAEAAECAKRIFAAPQ